MARLPLHKHPILKHAFGWRATWVSLLLLVLIVLRIPNFFEPYWYGDEGIYLTIGKALANGSTLYTDIVDHKTPLIYYLAYGGSQYYFRLLLLFWMLASTIFFIKVASKLLWRERSVILASLLFVVFTTLPWLEGHIPNGELFVIGFVLFAFAALTKTKLWERFIEQQPAALARDSVLLPFREFALLMLTGIALGGAVLTKVPALLDFAALGFTAVLILSQSIWQKWGTQSFWTQLWAVFIRLLVRFGVVIVGVAVPIIASVLYFVSLGSGADYLQFGLLYNLHYTGTWVLELSNPLQTFLFTFNGKLLVLAGTLVGVSAAVRYLPPSVQLSTAWLACAVFASLLSNRPYPHYFLQLVPPAALLIGSLLEELNSKERIATALTTSIMTCIIAGVVLSLSVGFYETKSYYQRSVQLITGQIEYHTYRNSFNYLMADNYAVAPTIKSAQDRYLFIWGTNPMLYALTRTQPTGRFTVAFHVADLGVYQETFDDFVSKSPTYVVTMHNEQHELPGLEEYLLKNYIPDNRYQNFTLWRKTSLSAL